MSRKQKESAGDPVADKEDCKEEKRAKRAPKEKDASKKTKRVSKKDADQDIEAVEDEKKPDEYEQAIIDYNLAYSGMNDAGIELFHQRERAIDLIGHVEFLVNGIANHPKSFDISLGEVSDHKKMFLKGTRYAEEELQAARKSAASASAGVAASFAVATIAPSAAMWVATTFGTASTGAAISTLSGAAATQAALAWLGGGTLATGGGGVAAGSTLLAMAGPIGWGLAGATLLTSIVLFAKKKHALQEEKHNELLAIKNNTECVKELSARIGALLDKTTGLRKRLSESFDGCMALFGSDYSKLPAEDQDRLAALVNNTLSLSALLGETLETEALPEDTGEGR